MLLSAAMFFCVLCAYYLLRPLREVFGIEEGPHYEWLWTWTAVATLALTPVFGWLVSHTRRRVFVPVVYGAGIVCLVAFHRLHASTSGVMRLGVGYAFYVFLSVFALFATMVFWGLMVDGWRDDAARRQFGRIAVGGTLGALCGSWLVRRLDGVLELPDLMLVAAGIYLATIAIAAVLMRRLEPDAAERADWVPETGVRAALAGVRLFSRSRYLLLIGVFLAAQTFAASFLYIESRAFVATALPDRGDRAAFFADIDIAYNSFALIVQLFLVDRLVRWVGIGAMLATLPLVNLAGFGLLAMAGAGVLPIAPSVIAFGVFEVAQRGFRFATMKPAREMLFTILSRDEKYQAKQFLDTAVYRSTDAAWAWISSGLRALVGPVALKLAVLVPVCAAWSGVAWLLGSMNRRRRAAALDASRPARAQ